ncbi:hypothetical protein CYMTET_20330 [Cymbomonas tetramitiformis]|uniref:Uncharacterized protein n=1 Tax=Cymbomonas tetramitiformis TaxID=36881 RepID=A0AAE0G497_9CHLO|nr:hypothetical protein CYMTET_20330 [Cymbomonas tetramitiformis]
MAGHYGEERDFWRQQERQLKEYSKNAGRSFGAQPFSATGPSALPRHCDESFISRDHTPNFRPLLDSSLNGSHDLKSATYAATFSSSEMPNAFSGSSNPYLWPLHKTTTKRSCVTNLKSDPIFLPLESTLLPLKSENSSQNRRKQLELHKWVLRLHELREALVDKSNAVHTKKVRIAEERARHESRYNQIGTTASSLQGGSMPLRERFAAAPQDALTGGSRQAIQSTHNAMEQLAHCSEAYTDILRGTTPFPDDATWAQLQEQFEAQCRCVGTMSLEHPPPTNLCTGVCGGLPGSNPKASPSRGVTSPLLAYGGPIS